MLGIQCRDEEHLRAGLSRLHCADPARAVAVERELLLRLEGGCQIPFGAHVMPAAEGWHLEAFLAAEVDDPDPLRLTLDAADPETLLDEAWTAIRAHRGR